MDISPPGASGLGDRRAAGTAGSRSVNVSTTESSVVSRNRSLESSFVLAGVLHGVMMQRRGRPDEAPLLGVVVVGLVPR